MILGQIRAYCKIGWWNRLNGKVLRSWDNSDTLFKIALRMLVEVPVHVTKPSNQSILLWNSSKNYCWWETSAVSSDPGTSGLANRSAGSTRILRRKRSWRIHLLEPLWNVYFHFSVSITLPFKPCYFGLLRIPKTFGCLQEVAFFLWKPRQKETLYLPRILRGRVFKNDRDWTKSCFLSWIASRLKRSSPAVENPRTLPSPFMPLKSTPPILPLPHVHVRCLLSTLSTSVNPMAWVPHKGERTSSCPVAGHEQTHLPVPGRTLPRNMMIRWAMYFWSLISIILICSSKVLGSQNTRHMTADMTQHSSPAASTVHQNPAITYVQMVMITVRLPRR